MEDATLLLGVIAVATAVMAAVQVGMFVCGVLLARRVNRLIEVVEHEVRPVVRRVGTLSDDAARLSSLAVTRIERMDRAVARITERLEETLKAAQDAVVEPARQGMALAHALRAALAVLRSLKERPPAADAARPRERDRARSAG